MIVCLFPCSLLAEQASDRVAASAAGGYSLESCTEGFVFPYESYSDQAVPLLYRGRKKKKKQQHSLCHVLTSYILTALTFLRIKSHLEVDWRGRIFRFYPNNT